MFILLEMKFIKIIKLEQIKLFEIPYLMSTRLPPIKHRFHTQNFYSSKIKNDKSIISKTKPFHQKSDFIASLSYIDQSLDFVSLPRNSSKRKSKKRNLQKIKTQSIRNQSIRNQTLSQSLLFQNPESIIDNRKSIDNLQVRLKQYSVQQNISIKKEKNNVDQRLSNILKHLQKSKLRIEQSKIKIKSITKSNRSTKTIHQYKLLPTPQLWTSTILSSFIFQLKQINPFIRKITELIVLCLLKVGQVQVYTQNTIVHYQDDPIKRIGIVLWGQVLLKCHYNKMKIYALPGDSINQELLFQNNNFQNIRSSKGQLLNKQTAKAKTNTGILYLKIKEYRQIYQQMVKIKQKHNFLTVQNMMKWSYAKKNTVRNQFSKN